MAEQVSETSTGGLGELPLEVQERNREIVADRLGWPDEALGDCRKIEARYPAWYCWWSLTPWPDPGFSPAYGAAPIGAPQAKRVVLYARTPGDLARLIGSKDSEERR